MGTSEPGVVGEACLLGRGVARAIDAREVEGLDDASFEFRSTGIGAMGEIDDAT